MKKSKRYRTTKVYLNKDSGGDGLELTLEQLAVYLETPEGALLKQERKKAIIEGSLTDPPAQEILKLQLDDDGYNAFTNQELAVLLDISVDEVENRKKRVKIRLVEFSDARRKERKPMPKRDTERLFEQIQKMADRLTVGDDAKPTSQLAGDLRQSGIDPDV